MKKSVLIVVLAVLLSVMPVMAANINITIIPGQDYVIYNSSPIVYFNVSTDDTPYSIFFYFNSIQHLQSCNPGGNICPRDYLLSRSFAVEGNGLYTFRTDAIGSDGILVQKTLSFYIDTISPVINHTLPINNSTIKNQTQDFIVNYTEKNLNNTILFWKLSNESLFTSVNVPNCESGTSLTCTTSLNLSQIPQKNVSLDYYFSIFDISGKSKDSPQSTLNICINNWNCPSWPSTCTSSRQQSITCNDFNGCDIDKTVTRTCTCIENWTCSTWSDGSCGSRTCSDSNSCGTTIDKPSVSQDCPSNSNSNSNSGNQDSKPLPTTFVLTSEQFNLGNLKNLTVNEKIKFLLFHDNINETHLITLKSSSADKITIEVSSTPQTVDIIKGASKKFELTDDKYYDLQVDFKDYNTVTKRTSIFIKKIYELIVEVPVANVTANTTESNTTSELSSGVGLTGAAISSLNKTSGITLIRIFGIIFGILVVSYALFFSRKKDYSSFDKSDLDLRRFQGNPETKEAFNKLFSSPKISSDKQSSL
jgi:hypothetical protein